MTESSDICMNGQAGRCMSHSTQDGVKVTVKKELPYAVRNTNEMSAGICSVALFIQCFCMVRQNVATNMTLEYPMRKCQQGKLYAVSFCYPSDALSTGLTQIDSFLRCSYATFQVWCAHSYCSRTNLFRFGLYVSVLSTQTFVCRVVE
jgi:hypothetical protein